MTEPTIAELADQIQAGLDADEQAARTATPGPWTLYDNNYPETIYGDGDKTAVVAGGRWGGEASVFESTADAVHIARHDPARVLAEVASKRALLDLALGWSHDAAEYGVRYAPCEALADPPGPCDCGWDERVLAVLQHLAQPYQEKPC